MIELKSRNEQRYTRNEVYSDYQLKKGAVASTALQIHTRYDE